MDASEINVSGLVSGAQPPKTVGLEYEVVRIVSNKPRHFVVLSEKGFGAWFHWIGRSVPCKKPESCERCKHNNSKWRCYVHCIELVDATKKSVIVELTLPAMALIEVQLAGQPFRGSQVKLQKSEGGKHGRFRVEVLPRRLTGPTLPEAHDCSETLMKLWSINERWDGPSEKIV